MDLGIAGKWALVCGASKGLGYGCAQALVREGVNVVINARHADALDQAAQSLIAQNPYGISATGQKGGSLPFRVEHYSSNKSIDTREQEPSRCKKRCSAKRWGWPRPGL